MLQAGMFAVVFETRPNSSVWDEYLRLAGELRPDLERVESFLVNERYRSLDREGWLLSLSLWRDEKALVRWRAQARHHGVQARGRAKVLDDYHLRVGEVTADNRPPAGSTPGQTRFDVTVVGSARALTFAEVKGDPAAFAAATTASLSERVGLPATGGALLTREAWRHVSDGGRCAVLAGWREEGAALEWQRRAAAAGAGGDGGGGGGRAIAVRVVRDYGMSDRREAPQYHLPQGQEPPG